MLPWHWIRRKTVNSWEISDHLTVGDEVTRNYKIEMSPLAIAALGATVATALGLWGVRLGPMVSRILGLTVGASEDIPHPIPVREFGSI